MNMWQILKAIAFCIGASVVLVMLLAVISALVLSGRLSRAEERWRDK